MQRSLRKQMHKSMRLKLCKCSCTHPMSRFATLPFKWTRAPTLQQKVCTFHVFFKKCQVLQCFQCNHPQKLPVFALSSVQLSSKLPVFAVFSVQSFSKIPVQSSSKLPVFAVFSAIILKNPSAIILKTPNFCSVFSAIILKYPSFCSVSSVVQSASRIESCLANASMETARNTEPQQVRATARK